jgi:hypothetical protein
MAYPAVHVAILTAGKRIYTFSMFGDLTTYARLPRAPLLFLEEMALLSRRLYNNKVWLPLTFEVKSTAAISEMGIVGNVVVGAVVTTLWLVIRFFIHRSTFSKMVCEKGRRVYECRSTHLDNSRCITTALGT